MNKKPLSINKTITTKTLDNTYVYSRTWRHPQVISFHMKNGDLVNKCLGCSQECDREMINCICSCNWEPTDEELYGN